MRFSKAIPGALISCATGAILAGCSGSQSPGAMPQTSTVAPARVGAGPIRSASAPYQVLYSFVLQHGLKHHREGSGQPLGGLLNVNGTLYGTTQLGGKGNYGTVYSVTTTGTYNQIYAFRGGKKGDGEIPLSGLIDVNGTLYGTTWVGGSSGNGTVYSVGTTGAEKVLYSFTGGAADGANPNRGDLLYMNGTLYGTTVSGGYDASVNCNGCGTVYSITTSGEEKMLYAFKGGKDGGQPSSGLINVNGTMYGTTSGVALSGHGTVYSITTSGQEKVLYRFAGSADGLDPNGLVNVNGTLYGTTESGGTYSKCATGFFEDGCGTVYRITTSGKKKILYNFRGGSDGGCPSGPLIHFKGKLYGTTYRLDGSSTEGTVYSITTSGKEQVLYRFTNKADGLDPTSPLLNVNGTLDGTTLHGGIGHGWGVIYSLTP